MRTESAARKAIRVPLTTFKQGIARKTTLVSFAQRKLRTQKMPVHVHPSVGKFTQSIDCANLLYNQLSKKQARILALLRTRKSRLSDYLSGIGGAETHQCICGTGRETIRHFLFRCPKWDNPPSGNEGKAAGRWGDLSYFLGGRSHAQNKD